MKMYSMFPTLEDEELRDKHTREAVKFDEFIRKRELKLRVTTFLFKLFWLILLLVAFRLIATEVDEASDYCYYDTTTKEIKCMAYRKRLVGNLADLPVAKKRIHADRLLIKAEKNIKKRKALHHYLAKLVISWSEYEEEMAVMGEEYLRELRDLESEVIVNGK